MQRPEERFGGVDVLVNNAGYGYRAAVEEGDDADVRQLFETHFFGTVATIKAVLPGMRARRSGTIVNISSIGAQLPRWAPATTQRSKPRSRRLARSAARLPPWASRPWSSSRAGFAPTSPGARLPSRPQSSTTTPPPRASAAKRHDTMHGTQAGDPAKAGAAIIAPSNQTSRPRFLLLGPDALGRLPLHRRGPRERNREVGTAHRQH